MWPTRPITGKRGLQQPMVDRSEYWHELDVLRGLAAAAMVLNHVGVAWLAPETGSLAGALSLLGSFAPVLFFFVTGWGYGLAHQEGRPGSCRDLLFKAGVLVLMDLVLSRGRLFWDFLGFIALSMCVLHLLRGRRHARVAAGVLLALTLGVRFCLAPLLKARLGQDGFLVPEVLGLRAMPGVSYWFTPWLAYPLLGFLLGALTREHQALWRARALHLGLGLVTLGLLGGAITSMLVAHGANLFRWGMMSLGFFVASMALLAMVLGLVVWCAALAPSRLRELVSLRGIASLAVVPLHYGLLQLAGEGFERPVAPHLYVALLPLWLLASFALARFWAWHCAGFAAGHPRDRPLAVLGGVLLLLCWARFGAGPALADLLYFVAELGLCQLLAFSYAKRKLA